MSQFTEADTIRILVASDNHVGFEERDSIRKDDSWQTFDEIMDLARTEDVDMVLLGGDLFHENKPSRKAMYKVMRSLRKNCLGMKPVELQFLSDASNIFGGHFTHVNYEDPDINVSIPVFSIHGNHDDPSGDGAFCPLDILQAAGLLNYIGRIPEADSPEAKPVFLQKGLTKLALYGLSNVRDERMHRNFRDHKVKWYRPEVQPNDWFNLLAVHQNHHAHTATSYLPEGMLPEWLDLVVWGHEHECKLTPLQNAQTGFHVIQPGSSIATSLVPGEAEPKHVAIVSVTGKEFVVNKIRLRTVRPLITREIKLSDDPRFKNMHKKDSRPELTSRLMEVVDEMIEEANSEWLSIQEEEVPENERPLPLVRLKVEYTAPDDGSYDIENLHRFSNRFAGRVANTNDVVYFFKRTKTQRKAKVENEHVEIIQDPDQSIVQMDAIVGQFLEQQSLKILPQGPFSDAVHQYVSKDDKHAMDEFVKDTLTTQVKQMLSLDHDQNDLEDEMTRIKLQLEKSFKPGTAKSRRPVVVQPRPDEWDSDMDGHWSDQPGVKTYADQPATKTQAAKTARGRPKKTTPVVENEDEEMEDFIADEEEEAPASKARARGKAAAAKPTAPAKAAAKKAPAKTTAAKGRSRKAVFVEESEDDEVSVEETSAAPPKRSTNTRSQPARSQPSRATVSQAQTKKKQSTLNFSQPPKASQAMEISDDQISDDDDPFEAMPVKRTTRKR